MSRWAALAVLLGNAACGSEPVDARPPGEGGGGGGEPVEGVAIFPCPPGELDIGGSCKPPGVPADGCGEGFVHDGQAGCDPTLPPAPCSGASLALIGEAACQPVADCGTGTWGDIPSDTQTEHVDPSYAGGNNDGSAGAPWIDIADAIAAAPAGGMIALAAGSYPLAAISAPIRIWGRCPDMVALTSDTLISADVELHAVKLRSVAISDADLLLDRVWVADGSGVGIDATGTSAASPASMTIADSAIEVIGSAAIRVEGAVDVSIARSHLRGTGASGLHRGVTATNVGTGRPSVVLRHTLVEGMADSAVAALGSDVSVEDSAIRDTALGADGWFGVGLFADVSVEPSEVTLTRSVISRGFTAAILAFSSSVSVDASVMRDIAPSPEIHFGSGVMIQVEQVFAGNPILDMSSSLLERTTEHGIYLNGADGDLEALWVRDVAPRFDGFFGRGIDLEHGALSGMLTAHRLHGARIERVHEVGMYIGAHADIEAIMLREVAPRGLLPTLGVGLVFHPNVIAGASGSARQIDVAAVHMLGIGAIGADIIIEDALVRDVRPQLSNDDFGDGIVATSVSVAVPGVFPTHVRLTRGDIAGMPRAGVAAFSADLELSDSLLDCNAIQLDKEKVTAVDATIVNGGGVTCRCGAAIEECQVLSSSLEPPTFQ